MRKELDGFSAKIHGKTIRDFPCYLIGQLARNSRVDKSVIRGDQLLQYAYDVIKAATEAVGGRFIMIECREDKKLIEFYEENQFKEIARVSDDDIPMVQMLRKIV